MNGKSLNFLIREGFFQKHLILFLGFLLIGFVFHVLIAHMLSEPPSGRWRFTLSGVIKGIPKVAAITFLITFWFANFVPSHTHSSLTKPAQVYPNNENYKIVFPVLSDVKTNVEISDVRYSDLSNEFWGPLAFLRNIYINAVFVKGEHTHEKTVFIKASDMKNLSESDKSKVVKAEMYEEDYEIYTLIQKPKQVTKRYMKLTFDD